MKNKKLLKFTENIRIYQWQVMLRCF